MGFRAFQVFDMGRDSAGRQLKARVMNQEVREKRWVPFRRPCGPGLGLVKGETLALRVQVLK